MSEELLPATAIYVDATLSHEGTGPLVYRAMDDHETHAKMSQRVQADAEGILLITQINAYKRALLSENISATRAAQEVIRDALTEAGFSRGECQQWLGAFKAQLLAEAKPAIEAPESVQSASPQKIIIFAEIMKRLHDPERNNGLYGMPVNRCTGVEPIIDVYMKHYATATDAERKKHEDDILRKLCESQGDVLALSKLMTIVGNAKRAAGMYVDPKAQLADIKAQIAAEKTYTSKPQR